MLVACQCADHLVHEVVDVEQLHLHAAVVDLYGQAVRDVVAEGGDGGVVVGAAPLAEEVGEAIDEHLRAGFLPIGEEQLFARLLAAAVLAVAEAAGEGGLDGRGEHHGAAVAVLAERIEQDGGEAEVALHELFLRLRAVHPGEVEHEIGLRAPAVEVGGGGVYIVFIDFGNGEAAVPARLAVPYVLQLGAEVAAYEPLGSRDEDFHGCFSIMSSGAAGA